MSRSLTKNQQLVLDVLTRAHAPMRAYTILEQLRAAGLKSPPQIYRALTALCEHGYVHKLPSLNRFVACQSPACTTQQVHAFAICETCDSVTELQCDALIGCLDALATRVQFGATQSTVEMHGRCLRCQAASSESCAS
jgi:Fur family zinc uptake transcriptional regulator